MSIELCMLNKQQLTNYPPSLDSPNCNQQRRCSQPQHDQQIHNGSDASGGGGGGSDAVTEDDCGSSDPTTLHSVLD